VFVGRVVTKVLDSPFRQGFIWLHGKWIDWNERKFNIQTGQSADDLRGSGSGPVIIDGRRLVGALAASKYNDGFSYQAPDYANIFKVAKVLDPCARDIFYDIGSGRGRVLCVMATYGMEKVVGVELVEDLCVQARLNAAQMRGRRSPIEVIIGDACQVDLREGTIYFFFNPFGPSTFREVLDNIRATLDSRDRTIRIVYYNAIYERILYESDWLGDTRSLEPALSALCLSGDPSLMLQLAGFRGGPAEPGGLKSAELPVGRGVLVNGQEGTDAISFCINDRAVDPEWDAFLAQCPRCHHVQSSLWAQIKSAQVWRAVRSVAMLGKDIIGGSQLLYRPLGFLGAVGYVQGGPVIKPEAQHLAPQLLAHLLKLARNVRVKQLYVQPPLGSDWLDLPLRQTGFTPSTLSLSIGATTIVDVSRDVDAVLAGMNRDTRRDVRRGTKRGLRVRRGGEADMRVLADLLSKTAERKNFVPDGEVFFREMWRVLEPGGYLRLLIVENDGESVSAGLSIGFGDTVVYKRTGWCGQHRNQYPNELLVWSFMLWAREQGFRYFDFDGIDPRGVLGAGCTPDKAAIDPLTSFKLGFGGDVLLLPTTYEISLSPLFRVFSEAIPRLHKLAAVRRLLKRQRERQ
jgi:lipid II:glycine glycyltransferase (peptidoglycan interpeptide bridge formation enzyme)